MSYKVKRIFIKNDNDIYTELSYQEWIHSTENRNLLRNRKFIAAGDDALMEVSETEYRDFARLERHLRYLNYLDSIHHLERYGAIITDMNAQEINVQDADDVSEEAEKKILLKKLRICLSKLSAEQQEPVQTYSLNSLRNRKWHRNLVYHNLPSVREKILYSEN